MTPPRLLESTLLRSIGWMIRRLAPASRADTILADLEEDYLRAGDRRRLSWLVVEASSLLSAYAWARVTSWLRRTPLLFRDMQLVGRGLRRGGPAIVASATLLSVGIAAALVTAGLVDALLLRRVSPSHDALRRVVAIDQAGRSVLQLSLSELHIVSEYVGDTGQVSAVSLAPVVLRVQSTDIQTMAEVVEGPYFTATGMTTLLGRGLSAMDEHPGSPSVTVLSEPFWRHHLGAAPAVLGTTVRLNGGAFTVIGVAKVLGSSAFLGASVDAWVSARHADPLMNRDWRTDVAQRQLMAFVRPTADDSRLEARLHFAAEELGRRYPDPWRGRRLQTSDATVMVGSQRTAASTLALVLGGLSFLILVSAASNVSSVLVARAAANQRAAAIHMSIGAGRALVVRRQLMEGGVVGAVAGLLAVALYVWVRAELSEVAVLPTLSIRLQLPLTAQIAAVALGGGALAGLLLAIAPAVWSTRLDLTNALREEGRAIGSGRASRVRRALVSVQIGLSLVLVAGALMFIRSLGALERADLGFPRDQLVAMDFDVEPTVQDAMELPRLAREALNRVESIPGIVAAAMSNRAPVDQSTPTIELQRPGDEASRIRDVTVNVATERYFDTVGVPLVRGRTFTASEASSSADVVIVNQSLAQRLWPDGDAMDRAIYLVQEAKTVRVVGVARDAKYSALTESGRSHVYRPAPPGLGLTLLARSRTDPREALRAMQRELDKVGPGIVGFFPRTMDDHLAVQLLTTRAAATAATVLGGLALALSASALYALVAWFVLLRRRELGVRMALGASPRDVRRFVVGQALMAAMPGLLLGLPLAMLFAMFAQSLLFGVGPADPVAMGAALIALLAIVLLAGYLPSRGATAMDPSEALRH